jgi:hypothetical protein
MKATPEVIRRSSEQRRQAERAVLGAVVRSGGSAEDLAAAVAEYFAGRPDDGAGHGSPAEGEGFEPPGTCIPRPFKCINMHRLHRPEWS